VQIISPDALNVQIGQKGLPVYSDLYATKDIKWADLLKNQTERPSLNVLQNLLSVAIILQAYKDKVFNGVDIVINSGWRSKAYNAKIGGAKNSWHVLGKAVDFCVAGYMPLQIYKMLDKIHFGGLERADKWTHFDIRGRIDRFDSQDNILTPHFSLVEHDKIFRK
jgi:hypothetical protein